MYFDIYHCRLLSRRLVRDCCCFFFFKQKTAYEMRISDWSSDVCSSDLIGEEMDFGDMVGAFAITSADDVPPHALQAELTALGNDGTFFDDRMEHADD